MQVKDADSAEHTTLGDETFMSAEDLREYMTEMQMAKATKEFGAMDRAEEARKALVKKLSEPIELTPEALKELNQRLISQMRVAAQRGQTQVLVMRFPNSLCTDKGRAINNGESGWPDTLTGRPRQAYEYWQDHLKPAKYKLRAMIIEWPGGLPGDVGFYLSWG